MKKKNMLLITSGIILLVIAIVVGYYFFFHQEKKIYSENNNKIVSKEEYLGYKYNSEELVNYYINNGNKFIGFNKKNGNKTLEIEMSPKEFYKMVNYMGDIINFYSYKDEKVNEYKLFDINGDLLKTSKSTIKVSNDIYNNKSYYIYENSLYDENSELLSKNLFENIDISKETFIFNVYGSYVVFTNCSTWKLLNLKNNKVIDIKNYFEKDKFVEIETKNSFYLLDLEKDELDEYTKSEDKPYGKILYKNESKYIYTNSEIIKYEDKLDYEGYQLDFTVCEDGFKIYQDGNLVSDECFYQYHKDAYNNTYVSNLKSFYLRNGKLDEFTSVGNYYINSFISGEIVIYNDKKEKVSEKCSNEFSYYRNGLYVCNDGDYAYLVNESIKKVTDNYDELVCSETYCKMYKNEKYGLLYNDKVILEPIYSSINLLNNAIIAEDSYKLDYFLLGSENFLSEDKLYREIDEYKNINIEQTISEYNLKDIEDLINIDSDFFKQYAYVVMNNNGLDGFKEYVLKAYKEVILNKEYLSKEYFLYHLKQLSIEKVNETDVPGMDGEYTNNTIHILYSVDIRTLYHELTHFINNRLNSNSGFNSISIYKYLDKYILDNEYDRLSKDEKKKVETVDKLEFNFLKEGGAEYYTGVYFNNMKTYTYAPQVIICNIFSYIYGSDFMREIFFGEKGQELLYKKFSDIEYNYEEIKKFIEITNRIETGNVTNIEKMYYLDMLISLYEQEQETKWHEDDIFSYFIAGLLPYDLKETDTNRFDEYRKIANTPLNITRKIYEKLGDSSYTYLYNVMYFNDDVYISVDATRIIDGEMKYQIISFIYDIDKNELVDYKTIDK